MVSKYEKMFLLETESALQKKITSLPRASGLIFFEIRKNVSIRNGICSSEKNYLSSKGFGPGFFRNTKKVFLSETESVLQKKITSLPRASGLVFFEIRKKCFYQKQNPLFRKNSSFRRVLKLDLFQKKQKRRPRLYGPTPFSQFLNSLYFCSALLCCYRD